MGSSELRPRDRRQATLEGNDRALGDAGEPAATVRAFFHFGSSFFFSVWRKVQGGTLPGLCMDWDRGCTPRHRKNESQYCKFGASGHVPTCDVAPSTEPVASQEP